METTFDILGHYANSKNVLEDWALTKLEFEAALRTLASDDYAQAEIFVSRHLLGLTMEEIASSRGITPHQARYLYEKAIEFMYSRNFKTYSFRPKPTKFPETKSINAGTRGAGIHDDKGRIPDDRFAEFFIKKYKDILQYARRICSKNPEISPEDLVQNAFLRFSENNGGHEVDDNPRAILSYIFKIVQSARHDEIRKNARQKRGGGVDVSLSDFEI